MLKFRVKSILLDSPSHKFQPARERNLISSTPPPHFPCGLSIYSWPSSSSSRAGASSISLPMIPFGKSPHRGQEEEGERGDLSELAGRWSVHPRKERGEVFRVRWAWNEQTAAAFGHGGLVMPHCLHLPKTKSAGGWQIFLGISIWGFQQSKVGLPWWFWDEGNMKHDSLQSQSSICLILYF